MPLKPFIAAHQPLYYPAVDGLRFIAFLLVFIGHFHGFIISNYLSHIGWSGVELFFLLSGFLLTKLLVTEYNQTGKVNLYKYFIRRVLRIWPLYFLYLFAIIIVFHYLGDYPVSLSRLLGNIFFYDNIMTALYGLNQNLATGHLWSISLEEQYYLVLPFLIPLLIIKPKKRILFIIIPVFVFLIIIRYFLAPMHLRYTFVYALPLSGDSFLAGILLGLGIIDKWAKKINTVIAFLLGIGFLILLVFLPHASTTNNEILLSLIYLVPALAFFFIFIAVVYTNQGPLFWVFCNKPIRYLGKISFGLYIFHVLANRITYHFYSLSGKPMDGWGFLLSLSITVGLSILSYELFEKYFLKMKSKFTIIKNRDV
jgi:peptidoglycan/LPS O-acetylase OafA/YrhL